MEKILSVNSLGEKQDDNIFNWSEQITQSSVNKKSIYFAKYLNLPNFLTWKFCGKINCDFPQKFFTRKLGEITGF